MTDTLLHRTGQRRRVAHRANVRTGELCQRAVTWRSRLAPVPVYHTGCSTLVRGARTSVHDPIALYGDLVAIVGEEDLTGEGRRDLRARLRDGPAADVDQRQSLYPAGRRFLARLERGGVLAHPRRHLRTAQERAFADERVAPRASSCTAAVGCVSEV